jgi:hypothetical protein
LELISTVGNQNASNIKFLSIQFRGIGRNIHVLSPIVKILMQY